MDTKQSSRTRPKLVWVISIFCIISIGFNILSYALIFNGTIPITEAQRAHFESLTQFSYDFHIPERRSGKDRRSGFDRRLKPRTSK